jgi:hypothetical protein
MSFPRYPKYKPSGVEWLGEVPDIRTSSPVLRAKGPALCQPGATPQVFRRNITRAEGPAHPHAFGPPLQGSILRDTMTQGDAPGCHRSRRWRCKGGRP